MTVQTICYQIWLGPYINIKILGVGTLKIFVAQHKTDFNIIADLSGNQYVQKLSYIKHSEQT